MFAENNVVYGNYVADGNAQQINLGFVPQEFYLWNETQQNSNANPSVVKEAWMLPGLAANSAYTVRNTAGARTDEHNLIAAGGFRTYSGIEEQLDAAIIGGAITAATPPVFTSAAHNYVVGDVVRIYGSTGMLQIAGIDFVVTAIVAGASFTCGTIPGAGFAAAGTAHTARRVWVPRGFYPSTKIITNVTAANPGVVTTNINHGFATGDRVRIRIPAISGMVQLDNQIVTVTNLTATTFSIGVDTTAYTAFAWPTSAQAAAGCLRPEVIPVGDTGQDLSAAEDNTAFAGIYIGSVIAGALNDVIRYRAIGSAIY